jgi:glycerophosphoryl diester phosphodiesterase
MMLAACSKNEYTVENINGNHITVMGHGGMGISSNYPLDALESILKSLAHGAEGTEIDVQLTKDSILVAFHDDILDNNTTLSGSINSKTWAEISGTHYTNLPYDKYPIVRLADIFDAIENVTDYSYTFDCKLFPSDVEPSVYENTFANRIVSFIQSNNLTNHVYVEASNKNFILELHLLDSTQRILYYPSSFEEGRSWANTMGLHGITISTANISKEEIELAHGDGLFVAIWNTHSKKLNREAILKNPDMIQTDRLKYLLKELN